MAETCTCRKCGRTGWTMDEFTSPHTGLCAECSAAESELIAAATRAAEGLRRLGWPDEAATLLAAIAAWEAKATPPTAS